MCPDDVDDAGSTYLLGPEVDVFRCREMLLLLANEPPDGNRTQHKSIDGDCRDPYIDEAGREVVAERAQGAPTLFIAAKRLLVVGGSRKITTAKLFFWPVARERSGMKQDFLLPVGIHDFDPFQASKRHLMLDFRNVGDGGWYVERW